LVHKDWQFLECFGLIPSESKHNLYFFNSRKTICGFDRICWRFALDWRQQYSLKSRNKTSLYNLKWQTWDSWTST
jgi:hypothetical protein